MATRLNNLDIYVQNEADFLGNTKDGSSELNATRLGQINPDLGYRSSAAATDDTGEFSLIGLFKRLLTKLPTLVNGRIPVEVSGGGGSGGGASPTEIKTAIETATNLDGVETTLTNILNAVDGVEGFVDGVESGITTLNSSIVTLQGLVDQFEGYTDELELLLIAVRDRLMPQGTVYSALGESSGGAIKSSSGSVHSFTCTNLNSATRHFQLFNKISAPSTSEVPIRSFPVYGGNGFLCLGSEILSGAGISFTTGIAFGFSSTALTYTAAAATDAIISVRYS